MKLLGFFCIILFFFFLLPGIGEAKVLPQAKKSTSTQRSSKVSTTTGITVWPKLRSDRKSLTVSFGNLQNATEVSYSLTYSTDGRQEGVEGALSLGGSSSASRELLFGTCSKSVCRYHNNISNMKLEVSYASTAGKKYIKRFKIKV